VDRKDFSSVSARLQRALDEGGGALPASDPRSHVRSVQVQIEAIARGDIEGVLAEALPEVTLDIFAPPEFPWIRRACGADELRRALEQNFAAVVDQRPEITNVFAEGDTVALFGREQGRIRESGQSYDVEFVEKFTFRDGRLFAIRIIAAYVTANP
jgi:ketosteroid isomerase-like protein